MSLTVHMCRKKNKILMLYECVLCIVISLWVFFFFIFFRRGHQPPVRILFLPEENYPVVKYGLQDERNVSPNISPSLRDFCASYLDCGKNIFLQYPLQ